MSSTTVALHTSQCEKRDSPRERKVGLETEFTGVRREHLAVLEAITRDERTVEHGLDEELRVKVGRRRVERRTRDALTGKTQIDISAQRSASTTSRERH